ncbi:hypothetical protein ACFLU8_02615 [Chloroflexota bacterium]
MMKLIFDIAPSNTYNKVNCNLPEGVALAQESEPGIAGQEQALDIEQIKRRMDMLDQRLDNIDSMVTAVAERVMRQPITFNTTCPKCGKNIEIAIIGNEKPVG